MSELTQEQLQEALEKQKAEFEAKILEQQAHIKALNEENKNKRLDSKQLTEGLKEIFKLEEPPKDLDIVREEISKQSQTIEELIKKLAQAETEKQIIAKTQAAKEIISKLNPHKVDAVLKFVDINSETLEDDIKKLAETEKYLFKPANVGGSSNPAGGSNFSINPFKKGEHYNLTQQALLRQSNPELALKYEREANN